MTTTVLVIEDTPANMKLVTMLLEHAGYAVLQATDAVAGIELARAHHPQLILMDMQLPGMDGLEATRVLKTDAATRDIRIVALTAFAMKGDEQRMLNAGCDAYIAKPIQYKEFLVEVASVLEEEGK
ncbi:MAG TPA: response regulator [Aromatoleum sp.]|uniref:response regulator n=1 Tax=Aromatoleum sp. TaxID=2307007 RepID=UPI002B47A6C5|nr:response regulator [Aromatoleum sp.]HJV24324.1 response regulator [Aromatoleum sp.]